MSALCDYLEIEPKEVLEIEKLGYFSANGKGLYDLQKAAASIVAYLIELKSKRGPKEKTSMQLPVYTSMAVCHAATGIPAADMRLAKAEGCEAFKGAKVYLRLLLPLLRYQPKGMQSGEMRAPRTRLDDINADIKQLTLDEKRNLLASKEEVKTDTRQALSEFYSIVERLFCSELPPTLLGLRELEVRQKCREAIEEAKSACKEHFKKYLEIEQPELPMSESSE